MAKHMTQDDRKVLEARYNAGQSVAGIARAMSFITVLMIWNVSGIFTSPGMRTGRACRKRLQSTPIPCGIL